MMTRRPARHRAPRALLVELRQHVALFLACAFGITALLCLLAWVYLRPPSSQSEHERTSSASQGSSRQGVSLKQTLMQNLFAERRHYRDYKMETTPDFSDVRAKVEQLEKQSQSRQAKAMNYAA